MKTFQYRGYDQEGRPAKGLIEALDLKDARERLAGGGVLAEKLETGRSDSLNIFMRRERFSSGVRAEFYGEIAALLDAGLPLSEAITILLKSRRSPAIQSVLANTGDALREGKSFSDALTSAVDSLPSFESAAITSGERAGNLSAICEKLAVFLEDQARIREKVVTASIYPLIVLSLGVVVALLMLGVMIPQVGNVLVESGLEVPGITRVMIRIGENLWKIILPLCGAFAVAVWMTWRAIASKPSLREQWSQRVFHIPLLGRGAAILTGLRFSQTLAFLLRGGLPMVDSLLLSGKATGNAWLEKQVAAASKRVAHGDRLSEALARIPVLGESMQGWLQAGEASGDLSAILEKASVRMENQWDRFIARALAVVEPVIIIFAGVCVFLLALSILLPILSLNKMLVL
ncbi:MAG: type II secretion system F family protein [Verrucomicrobia bacterium]|nr:type II secretion system F family protein [Verrucomicrobiota bacterium]